MSIAYLRNQLENLKREREAQNRKFQDEEKKLRTEIENENYRLEEENQNIRNQQYDERSKIIEELNNKEMNKLKNNIREKYEMEYNRNTLENEFESKYKNTIYENEHKKSIKEVENDNSLQSKKINNIFEEDLKRLNYDNKVIEIEKEKKLRELELNNIEQKNKYEEEKKNIENAHIIDMKKQDLYIYEKKEESKIKSKIDEYEHKSTINKEKNKTESEEIKLNQELLLNEKQIENDQKKALFNIQNNLEEQLMMQEIGDRRDMILLQMLNSQLFENAKNQSQSHQN